MQKILLSLTLLITIFPCSAQECSNESNGLFSILRAGKYGCINQQRAIVIAPRFAEARRFSEGLAVVNQGSDGQAGTFTALTCAGVV